MIECTSCHTLNPDSEAACLMCGLALPAALRSGPTGLRCPAGHPIDPRWRTCPYCDRGNAGPTPVAGGNTTRLETTKMGAPSPAFGMADSAGVVTAPQGRTRLEDDFGSAGQPAGPAVPKATRLETTPQAPHRTVLADMPPAERGRSSGVAGAAASSPGASGAPIQTEGRPLVGVLAAPGLRPGGAVFAVRQGKNMIGSDRASEICLGADPRVSLEHALLLHRGNAFYLADRMSTNGTWVNDVEVPANGTVVLRDRDRIRCGGVDLIFLSIDAPPDDIADATDHRPH